MSLRPRSRDYRRGYRAGLLAALRVIGANIKRLRAAREVNKDSHHATAAIDPAVRWMDSCMMGIDDVLLARKGK